MVKRVTWIGRVKRLNGDQGFNGINRVTFSSDF